MCQKLKIQMGFPLKLPDLNEATRQGSLEICGFLNEDCVKWRVHNVRNFLLLHLLETTLEKLGGNAKTMKKAFAI